jgi:hypothetical protein
VFRKGTSPENLNVGNETLKGILDTMKLLFGFSRFQRHAILPVLWIVLSAPLYNGLYLQSARLLRSLNTRSGLLLLKPNKFDSLTESVFASKEEEKGYLSSDQLKKMVPNYPTFLRKVMAEMCRDMSPQEAFEFRLQTRLDCRFVPYGTNTPTALGEQGLVYFISDPDFFASDGAEMRKLIEDDDRYRVAWCDPDLPKGNGTAMVLFLPQDSKEHQEKDAESSAFSISFRYFLRLLASIPLLTAYFALSCLGILLHPLAGIISYDEIMTAFIASFPVEHGPSFYIVVYILTIAGFSYTGTTLALTFMSKFLDLIGELKKDPRD